MGFDANRSAWLRDVLKPSRLTHIVDVGANPVEPVPYEGLLASGGCTLTGFEPQKEAFEKLQKIKGPNETYHQFAVGDGRVRQLYLMTHDTMTSFFEGDDEAIGYLRRFSGSLKTKSVEAMETVALDMADIGDFDLLKIDIQGGETIVFSGAPEKLSRAVAVIPEVRWYRLYRDEPMFAGVDQDLRARGFALHKFMFNKARVLPTSQHGRLLHEANENQLIDGDAVYIRDIVPSNTYSVEQMKHLAILSDGVWFSHDLTVRCLDHLADGKAIPPDTPAKYVDRLPRELRKDTPAQQAQMRENRNASHARD